MKIPRNCKVRQLSVEFWSEELKKKVVRRVNENRATNYIASNPHVHFDRGSSRRLRDFLEKKKTDGGMHAKTM